LHGWDPVARPVGEWLADRLGQTYPVLAGRDGAARTARLLAEGKIAVILDGLDEIPAGLQPVALRAMSQQATFRLAPSGIRGCCRLPCPDLPGGLG
jgi:hypothetical protein